MYKFFIHKNPILLLNFLFHLPSFALANITELLLYSLFYFLLFLFALFVCEKKTISSSCVRELEQGSAKRRTLISCIYIEKKKENKCIGSAAQSAESKKNDCTTTGALLSSSSSSEKDSLSSSQSFRVWSRARVPVPYFSFLYTHLIQFHN